MAFDISWFFNGIENFKVTVIKNSIVKIVSLFSIFLFVKSSSDVFIYILILGLSTLIGNFTLWNNLFHRLNKIQLKKLNPWKHLIPTLNLFLPQIATQIYVQLNRTMLGVMVSEIDSGYYQYSDTIIKLVLSLVTAIGAVMLPHIANAVSKGDINVANTMLYKSFNFVSLLAYPTMFGVASIAIKLAPKYFGAGYEPVGKAMMIESIIILAIAWSNALGVQYLIPMNRIKQFTASVTVGALVNILLNIPLIKLWGLYGAMFSTVISEISVTMYQLWVVRDLLKFKMLFKEHWKYISSSLVMFLIVHHLNNTMKDTWGMMVLEILVGMLVYGILLLIFRASMIIEGQKIIKSKFNL